MQPGKADVSSLSPSQSASREPLTAFIVTSMMLIQNEKTNQLIH